MGIDIAEFINDGGTIASQKISFIAWDFAGQVYGAFSIHANKPYICFLLLQEEYFITHHCFIVPGAIYAVCCKTQDLFESGVSTLLPWLAMIKVIRKL